jgi:hypothetical protein
MPIINVFLLARTSGTIHSLKNAGQDVDREKAFVASGGPAPQKAKYWVPLRADLMAHHLG